MLGLENSFHQPSSVIFPAGISEVSSRPKVGTSHSAAMNSISSCSGSLANVRTTRAVHASWCARAAGSGSSAAETAIRTPLA